MRCARCDRRLSEGDRFCGRCGLARSTDGKPVDPLIGITVAGRYRIERRIGVGGMGTVYLGTHVRIGQQVAVKVLHERYADDDQLTKRFEKEALTYGQVTHPNLVGLHDYGRTDDGTFFMVLEYCPGISLAQLVRRQGRLDAALAADILIQIAQGLGAAHAMGIVHRDLKPENVILTRIRPGRYHARLLDFGIAKRLDDDGPRLTAAGMVFGTPEYMAPEQARGKAVDARSDVYALGCVAYELLTGNPPFTGNDKLRIMHQQAGDPPPAIAVDPAGPPVPAALRDVTMRCLEKKPAERYADTEAFIIALERALGRVSAPAPAPTTERPMTDLGIGPTPPEASPAASTSRELGTLPQASPAGAEFGGFGSAEIESLPTDLGMRPSRPGPPARMLGAAAAVFVGVVAFSAWLFSAGEPAPTLEPATSERASVVEAEPEAAAEAAAQAAEAERLAAEEAAKAKAAEEERVAAEKAAKAKAAEEKRVAAEKAAKAKAKAAEEKRIAAEKAEAKRIAAEKAAEEKRIAEEKAAEAKRIAAEKAAKAAREAAIADARKALRMGQLDDVEKLLAGIEGEAPEAKQLTATLGTIRGALDQGRTAFEDADCVGTLAALEPVLDVAPGTRGVSHMVNSCRNSLPPRQL